MHFNKSEELQMFTHSERTVPKYTVYQALESARRRIEQKRRGTFGLNVTSVRGRHDSEKITLLELNRLAEDVYQDTMADLRGLPQGP